ncbi:MAG TPA: PLP-dependent aminotransferase family protein [Candidatus Saccharimonadales bacterium]|nr:PLP-dependent aminotransferase family protein [Candidatus Saccharimonadales bacterium]
MLLLTLDKAGAVPIYRQICERVVRLVDGGTLAPGDRLPPTRSLARTLGVHRSTVLRAYEELWALGYLESRPGSYSTVRQRARPVAAAPARRGVPAPGAAAGLLRWEALASPAARRAGRDAARLVQDPHPREGVIDFARLSADPRLAPEREVRACVRAALARHGGELLDYGDARGYPPLREAIARRMRAHGVAASADEILVTNGAQQGLDLVLRLLTGPGSAVVAESPTYSMALALFRFHGLALREVPMRADGPDLDALERALRRRPALVYTIPNFHNPTGTTTGQAHRERLLALCEARRVPILEDGFEEEMKYFGKAVLPIKSMDARGIVIYLGTFSKVVFPGLRVGWVAAPRGCVDRLFALQRMTNLTGNSVAQAAAARFCGSGLYEAYLRRVHRVYRRRMQAMLQGLKEHLPPGVEWTQPAGGYTLWLRVRGSAAGERAVGEQIRKCGVKVVPGSLFFPRPPADPHFRLSIACVSEEEIAAGCRRLGRALRPARRA